MTERAAGGPSWIREEALVDLPVPEEQLETVSQARGSLLLSSRELLSRLPELPVSVTAYEEALGAEDASALQKCMPSDWVPIRLASAHYAALDALRLPIADVRRAGELVARRIHDSPVFPLFRMAVSVGATPLSALVLLPKLWKRVFVGGGVQITRTGPKDVLVRAYKNPLFGSAYFRHACAGHVKLAAEVLASNAYVKLLPQSVPESCSYRVSWA